MAGFRRRDAILSCSARLLHNLGVPPARKAVVEPILYRYSRWFFFLI